MREAVVVARADARGHKRLVAYVVGEVARSSWVEKVREFLGESLPDYLVPSVFTPVAIMAATDTMRPFSRTFR